MRLNLNKSLVYWLCLFVLILGWVHCVQAEYQIDTIIGNGKVGYSGDSGDATQAQITRGHGLAVDSEGNLYLADTENRVIRKMSVETGMITTVAGCKDCTNNKFDGEKATDVPLKNPNSVAIDQHDNLYILDHGNYRVYKVDTKGIMTSFAGNGESGYSEGKTATDSKINPYLGNISVDGNGYLYIADRINHCIRVVKENKMTTVAGICGKPGNSETKLYYPADVKIDEGGNLYIADTGNHVIRKLEVNQKTLSTIVGTIGEFGYSGDDGEATEAKLNWPTGIELDKQGNLYIADTKNHRIRQVTNGIITTIAGNGATEYNGDGKLAKEASLNWPERLVLAKNETGVLYFSDKRNFRIRKLESIESNSIWILSLVFSLVVLLIIILYYLHFYHHPIVQQLSAAPSQLLKMPLNQLPQAKRLLQRTHRLDSVLNKNDIHITLLNDAIDFITKSDIEQRRALLATRIGVTDWQQTDKEYIFKLELGGAFPLNLTHCLLYLPPVNFPAANIITELNAFMRDEVIVVIHFDLIQQNILRSKGKSFETRWIIPNFQELTEWLLSPNSIEMFARLLASQLKVTTISPYQTGGGIDKDSIFFGRETILTQIFDRELRNYLIVGGRQMGKSSLLKKIQRYYQKNDSSVECFYLSGGDYTLPKLNMTLGLAKDAPLPTLLNKLREVPTGKKHQLILIDEADEFICNEIAKGYPILDQFRGVSEEDRCHLIFAGFWQLYEAIALDYHSPLVNFGESIRLGALEKEACQQLMTEPMALLGIEYAKEAKEELIQRIITETGQRANLISIVCTEMLKKLSNEQRVLNMIDVTKALNSQAIEEALANWESIFEDEQTARLSRIIVYATVEEGHFTLKDVTNLLEKHEYVYTAEQITELLKHLELAYVIQCEKGQYNYCVPLFRKMLLENNMAVLLEQELKEGKNG